MIAAIRGILEKKGTGWAVVQVGGISLQVHMPVSSLSSLGPVGKEVSLHTSLQVREDSLTLYGFVTLEELSLFQSLIAVSGVGPKLALSILSSFSPEQAALAISSGDVELLSRVPGIGKRTASRLVLELKGKVEKLALPIPVGTEENADVISALTNLGYTLAEATRAVSSLPTETRLSLEDKIRLALQNLGAR